MYGSPITAAQTNILVNAMVLGKYNGFGWMQWFWVNAMLFGKCNGSKQSQNGMPYVCSFYIFRLVIHMW